MGNDDTNTPPEVGFIHRPLEIDEEGQQKERWYYSKFALPCLFVCFLFLSTQLGLTFWQQTGDIKSFHDGVPRIILRVLEDETHEGGLPKYLRNIRISSIVTNITGVIVAFLIYFARPYPRVRRLTSTLASLLMLAGSVLAWIAFGIGQSTFEDAIHCPELRLRTFAKCRSRSGFAIAAIALDASLGVSALVSAIHLQHSSRHGHWRMAPRAWYEEQRDREVEDIKSRPPHYVAQKNVSTVRRTLTALSLIATLFISIALAVFVVLLHVNNETTVLMGRRGRTNIGNDINSSFEYSGWPTVNTRIRYAASIVGICTILLNLLPCSDALVVYIFGLLYLVTSALSVVSFGFDVHVIKAVFQLPCVSTSDVIRCTSRPFIVTAVFDIAVAVVILIYLGIEYVLNSRGIACRHCGLTIGTLMVRRHELSQCCERPVQCEHCGVTVTASDFIHKHRLTCGLAQLNLLQRSNVVSSFGPDPAAHLPVGFLSTLHPYMVRCAKCSAAMALSSHRTHILECPYETDKCQFCERSYMRMDLFDHCEECPLKPVTCDACGEVVRKRLFTQHYSVCPEVPQLCDKCGDVVARCNFAKHTSQECPCREMICDECGDVIIAYTYEDHLAAGCSETVPAAYLGAVISEHHDPLTGKVEMWVSSIDENGPCAIAGINEGDTIDSWGYSPLHSQAQVGRLLADCIAGDIIELTVRPCVGPSISMVSMLSSSEPKVVQVQLGASSNISV